MSSSQRLPQSSGRDQLLAVIDEEIEQRQSRRDLAVSLKVDFGKFIRAAWDVVEPAKPLLDNWHIDAIAEHCQAVADEKIRNLLINVGPGYAKSLIVSVLFSGWLWARNPQLRLLCGTYASSLTIRDSIRVRTLIDSPWYSETFQPEWKLIKRNEDHLSNDQSGFRMALSVDSAATGFRGDGQILDDIMNAKDAHSEAARETARRWVFETMSSRFNDMRKGWRIAIGQRLHEQDPYGEMIKTGDYELLCLPSEFEPERRAKTSIGWTDPRTVAGELLFPELFTKEVIAQAKRDLGSYAYAGQHQQRPAPAEGGLFKRDWWQYYQFGVHPQFELVALSVDATFKDSKDADFVAIHAYGFIGPRSYLLDRVHAKMGYSATKQAIRGMVARHKPAAILIEDKANGPAIIEELKKELPGVIAVNPEGGKVARAWAVSPEVEAGNCYLPELPWAQEVVEEAAQFPNAAHDDDVDAFTQAINWRRKRMFSYGLLDFYAATQKTIDEERMAKRGNNSAELLARAKKQEEGFHPAAEEELDKAVLTEEVAKVDVAPNTLRCPACESLFIQQIGNGKRCGNCGHQFKLGANGQPVNDKPFVHEGQVRK